MATTGGSFRGLDGRHRYVRAEAELVDATGKYFCMIACNVWRRLMSWGYESEIAYLFNCLFESLLCRLWKRCSISSFNIITGVKCWKNHFIQVRIKSCNEC